MSYTIRYRRPETPWSLCRMTVPTEVETVAQKFRLETLGYTVVEITPPLSVLQRSDGLSVGEIL